MSGRSYASRAAVFRQEGFTRVWVAGWLWSGAQWMAIFLAGYAVYKYTKSSFLVQLAAAAFWCPMLAGAGVLGAFADRVSRRMLCRVTLPLGAAAAGGIALGLFLASSTAVRVALVFAVMPLIGSAIVVNGVARRSLTYDIVGPSYLPECMTLESVSQAAGSILGPLLGGSLVSLGGIPAAVAGIGALLLVAFVTLGGRASSREASAGRSSKAGSWGVELRSGLAYARHSEILFALLGITAITNLCYFSFISLIPVIAKSLDVGPGLAGLLTAAPGVGRFVGAAVLAVHIPRNCGRVYVLGPLFALIGLGMVGIWHSFSADLGFLFLSGGASAGFASMQSLLVLATASAEMRGRAMGLLGMAIGAQPFGMVAVGIAASLFSAEAAVLGAGLAGSASLAMWARRHRQIYTATGRPTEDCL